MNNLLVYCEDEEGKNYPLQAVADAADKILEQTAPLAIEIAFVGEDEIRTLNRDKRGKDSVTDVLSFPYYDGIRYKTLDINDYAGDVDEEDGRLLVGSICVCEKRAKEQAADFGHSVSREVCYLVAHGILHCFGYDHIEKNDEEEMTALAEKIMSAAGIERKL